MAISEGDLIEFFGTQDTLGGTATAAVTTGSFSTIHATTGSIAWTNDDDAPMASITLLADWNTTAPDVGSGLSLFCRLLNVQSTNDGEVPDANYPNIYLGRFAANDVLTNQYITIDIKLPNTKSSQEYEFYLQNNTGETLQAGWDLYITPKTYGAHPA